MKYHRIVVPSARQLYAIRREWEGATTTATQQQKEKNGLMIISTG